MLEVLDYQLKNEMLILIGSWRESILQLGEEFCASRGK